MALVAFQRSSLPACRVIGTGTLLDTSRLRQEIAARLGVAPMSIDAMVLGEHGDSEVVAFSSLRIGGLNLEQFALTGKMAEHDKLAAQVTQAASEIIAGKGYTSFGVATAIVRIFEAIVRDEHAVLPVSILLNGELGVEGLYLSLPCILGKEGVERIVVPPLADEELVAFRSSAMAVQAALASIDGNQQLAIFQPATQARGISFECGI